MLKLALAQKYEAPIQVLNDYEGEELSNIINQYHLDLINELKEEYYSSSYYEMQMKTGFEVANFIRNFALCARAENLPFSNISETIKKAIERLDAQIDCFRSRSGSGSFPERFMDALLRQLDVNFEREVVFDWSKPSKANKLNGAKRYDFYLPQYNTIIEVHGAQHYSGGFEVFGGRNLDEEKQNDRLKQDIAIKNGVSCYIVINAAVSNIPYLKESVFSNPEFMALFDVSDIDWEEINKSVLGELDDNLPLYDLEKSYYEDLCSLFSVAVDEDSDVLPTKAFGDGCAEETAKLSAWKKAVHPSSNGLYPHEIVLLSKAKGFQYPLNPDKVAGYWFYDYGITNIQPLVERLASNGFLQIGDLECTLECSSYAAVKSFASRNGLKSSGKKIEIISRILANVPYHEIQEAFPQLYYNLTELGELELIENSYILDAVAVPMLDPLTRIWLAQNHPYEDINVTIQNFINSEAYREGSDDVFEVDDLGDDDIDVDDYNDEVDDFDEYATEEDDEVDELDYSTLGDDGESMYQIECALDRRTCDICGEMDQKVFKYSEMEIGVNYPPFHEGCRCCAVPYFENLQGCERAARDRDGKTIYVTNMDWHKWRRIYGGKK